MSSAAARSSSRWPLYGAPRASIPIVGGPSSGARRPGSSVTGGGAIASTRERSGPSARAAPSLTAITPLVAAASGTASSRSHDRSTLCHTTGTPASRQAGAASSAPFWPSAQTTSGRHSRSSAVSERVKRPTARGSGGPS